jgi:hypothetical protein
MKEREREWAGMCGPEQTPELQWVPIRVQSRKRVHSGASSSEVCSCELATAFIAHFIAHNDNR